MRRKRPAAGSPKESPDHHFLLPPPETSDDETKKFLNRLVQEWRVTLDSLADCVFLVDREGFVRRCNRAFTGFLSLDFPQIIGQDCRRLIPELAIFLATLPERTGRLMKVVPLRGRWHRVAADPLYEAEQRIRGWTFILTDIHEQRLMEEELRSSEERFRLLFESAPVGIALSRGQHLLYVNPACLQMFGYRFASDVHGTRFWKYIVYPGRTQFREIIARLNQPSSRGFSLDLTGRNSKGGVFPIHVELSQFFLSDGPAVMAFIIDLSERQLLEERLAQSQKMESLGQLASGVAHDFNNILTGIVGYADLALVSVHQPHPLYDAIHRIRLLGERASSITKKLLAFSRKQVLEPRHLNLNLIITDLLKLLGKTLGETIEIEFLPAPDLKSVYADISQMEQVLMNLCLNARDAMAHGGRLVIRTENRLLAPHHLPTESEAQPGSFILLEVADTGLGVPKELLGKIFEPFFTTKEAGKGTGLGLAMVHGIILQQGGFIEVESDPGRGACFRIFLPVAEGSDAAQLTDHKATFSGGDETILIVEDDPDVLELIVTILGDLGYRMISASDGETGLRIFMERQKDIALVITDVVMPRISGKQLQERILALNPYARVLFISGYTANEFPQMGGGEGIDFLSKPFTPTQLGARVREILDGK